MRIIILVISFVLLSFFRNDVQAGWCPDNCGGGVCAESETCGYQNLLMGACAIYDTYNMQCYPQYSSCTELNIYEDNPLSCPPIMPEGETCSSGCEMRNGAPCYVMEASYGTGCFEEATPVWCCNIIPTSPPTGDTGTGTVPPTSPPTAPPTTTPFMVTVNSIVEDNSYLSGGVCQQANSVAQNVSTGQIFMYNDSGYGQVKNLSDFTSTTFTLDTATTYNIMVTIPKSDALQFTCPTSISETATTYTALYSDVYISPTTNTNISFYLRNNNLAADWFQVFGGNIFTNNRLRSPIPSVTCGPSAVCSDALIAALTADPASSGHPFLLSTNALNLQTSESASDYHHFISPSDKTSNLNSYVTGLPFNEGSYQGLLGLVSTNAQSVNATDNPTLWRTQAWWDTENAVVINGDLNINETNAYSILDGENLTVFVSGNLTLSDSNPADSNRKITSVARGGFLAFVVQGDITIGNTVGWALDPAAPTTPAVNLTNANLEGVFIANNRLILESNNAVAAALPDRKFIGAGTFVGWNGVELNRSFDDGGNGPVLASTQAVENFIYRPDFLANWPESMKITVSSWRELDPSLVGDLAPFVITATPSPPPPSVQYTFTPTTTPTPTPTESPTPTPTPVQIFADIPTTHWAYTATKTLYENNITGGCGSNPLIYCPDDGMRRDQAATLMVKTKYGASASFPLANPAIFSDVPDGNALRQYVEKIYNDGITGGCGSNPLRYCPTDILRRDQAAIFLVRLKYGSSYVPTAGATPIFSDVGTDNVFRAYVEKLYTDGIVSGCGTNPLRYCPADNLTRATMALMLHRLFF